MNNYFDDESRLQSAGRMSVCHTSVCQCRLHRCDSHCLRLVTALYNGVVHENGAILTESKRAAKLFSR